MPDHYFGGNRKGKQRGAADGRQSTAALETSLASWLGSECVKVCALFGARKAA